MKKEYITAALVAAGLAFGTGVMAMDQAGAPQQAGGVPMESLGASPKAADPQGQASPSHPGQGNMAAAHAYLLSASGILGREVRNGSGERLGTVKDLIVGVHSDTAPFAIVTYGGALGIGETRVAVPFNDLRWAADTKEFIMAASKEQLEAASPVPLGGWAFAANQDWARGIDRFYGNPATPNLSLNATMSSPAPGSTQSGSGRHFVGEGTPPDFGARQVYPPDASMPIAQPDDHALLARITRVIEHDAGPADSLDVQVAGQKAAITVKIAKGAVTLTGNIATGAEKQRLENRIKAVSGVVSLNDDYLATTSQ